MQYKSLQAGRGVAALLVIVSHIPLVMGSHAENFRNQGWNLGAVRSWTAGGALGVEFFFVLSGIVILLAHRRDLGKPTALRTYVIKRFRRIYPIYWLIATVSILLSLYLGKQHESYLLEPYTLISNILLVHIGSLYSDLLVAWTLFHEILFYGIFGLSILNARYGGFAFALWIAGSVLMLFHPLAGFLSGYLLSPLHILFAWGCLVGWFVQRRKVPVPAICVAVGLAVFTGAYYLCGPYTEFNFWVQQMAGLGVAVTVAGLLEMERGGRLPISARLAFLGDASYSIYLAHLIGLNLALRFLALLGHQIHIPLIIAMAVLFVCAVIVGCYTHLFVEVPLLHWVNKRVGSMSSKSVAA